MRHTDRYKLPAITSPLNLILQQYLRGGLPPVLISLAAWLLLRAPMEPLTVTVALVLVVFAVLTDLIYVRIKSQENAARQRDHFRKVWDWLGKMTHKKHDR